MLNRKYYSFERNNYFYGKLLTSRDFESEQEYMNNKRRFLNSVLYGAGIVYGLNVLKADDASIIVQSGAALDGAGREIVVPKTQVIKLATIEGYQELTSSKAYLGIAYQEEKVDPTYSVMGTDGEEEKSKRYNGIREGFRLYLMDEEACLNQKRKEEAFIRREVIFQDSDIMVIQKTPAYITRGRKARVKVEIVKLSHAPELFSIQYQLVAEGFAGHGITVAADNLNLEYGERTVLEYELIPEAYIFSGNEVTLTMRDIEIQKSEKKEKLKKECSVSMQPVQEEVLECVLKNSYKGILDVDLDNHYDDKLWIAKIDVLKSGSSVLIENIENAPLEQYVYNTEQLMAYNHLNEFLLPEGGNVPNAFTTEQVTKVQDTGREPAVSSRFHSSGVFEMSLGNGGEAGKVYYSDEIMHGLGEGAVYVEVGIEYLTRDTREGTEREEIILGDNSIFIQSENKEDEKMHPMDSAVKILPGRGTFVVGVRPKVKTGKIGLRIRWYAFKPEDLQQRVMKKEQSGCIMIQPDTIVVQPKGTAHINPVFINMPEEALMYTLLDTEGGKIDNNGTYTAPAQEGVYEIKVSCISNPDIFAQAFIIVSQKKEEN
ncbi:MAG: hypothetical protein ACI4DO_06695 [Roseburia sp.]